MAHAVCRVRVVLRDVDPPVWRRLLVPADLTLGDLHEVLQIAMGWTNSHLHRFEYGGRTWSDPRADLDLGENTRVEDENTTTIDELCANRSISLRYEYDFGDLWEHDVNVERLAPASSDLDALPLCDGGARACPPEDVGGTWGYAEFLAAVGDPEHEEHESLLEWVGGAFDPEAFDADVVAKELRAWTASRRRRSRSSGSRRRSR